MLDLLAGDRGSDAVARARARRWRGLSRLAGVSGPFGSGCGASGAPGSGCRRRRLGRRGRPARLDRVGTGSGTAGIGAGVGQRLARAPVAYLGSGAESVHGCSRCPAPRRAETSAARAEAAWRRWPAGRPNTLRLRGALGHADADLAEARVEDVVPVRRAVHPGRHDAARRGAVGPGPPGEVLAHEPAATPAGSTRCGGSARRSRSRRATRARSSGGAPCPTAWRWAAAESCGSAAADAAP